MTVLITGAGGFLGSAVVRAFVAAGHDVRAHLGAPGDAVIALPAGMHGICAEITDDTAFASLLRGTDACLHLAGPASVATSFAAPQAFSSAHVVGTANVLQAASTANVERFVYVSSAEVYGRPGCHPVREDQPLEPRSPYGAAKAGAEASVAAAVRSGAIGSCAILRPFSIYGPNQRSNSLVGSIVRQALYERAVVLDDLGPERDYCYVDDVALALMRACTAPLHGIAIANLGSGSAVSVGDLARTAVAATGRDIPVYQRGAIRPAQAEIHRLVADIERARVLLEWCAGVSLPDGLRRCFDAAVVA